MNSKKYYDSSAVQQIIGDIYKQPSLLDSAGQYELRDEDFILPAQKLIYGTFYNLYQNGAKSISLTDVENYVRRYDEAYALFKEQNVSKFILECAEFADISNFKYYYERIKKMTLLRKYTEAGVDVSWILDPDNLVDIAKKEAQEREFDSTPISDIAKKIEDKILLVNIETTSKLDGDSIAIGDSIFQLLDQLEDSPEVGMPFSFSDRGNEIYSSILNRVTLGARKGKFYLRSAASGVGKTRTMMADACMLACKRIWMNGNWVDIISNIQEETDREGVLFISTELDISEVQTLALSFISGVNEEKILTRNYTVEEMERVRQAAIELQDSTLRIEQLPNFTVADIENVIKRNHIVHKCNYIFYDYLGTSLGILEEIGSRTHGVSMREDSILFLLSTRLKELAVQYNIFIESSTQLNADFKTSTTPDQNLLRGAKSIADRIDLGTILLNATAEDISSLTTAGYIAKWGGMVPNTKLSVYKNRRGKYVNCYIWMFADKGTCRFTPIGATTWNYEPYEIPPLTILAQAKEAKE